jgi:hypothetical protein
VSAGDGWNAFTTAWRAALGRLANSQETFAYNTEAAAVRYEDADHRSMQEFAPPVIPSPEDIHRAWEEACEPGMLGDIPEECLLASAPRTPVPSSRISMRARFGKRPAGWARRLSV